MTPRIRVRRLDNRVPVPSVEQPRFALGSNMPTSERIGYLVHDLGDAAVDRRIRMFRAAGLDVTLAGFSRAAPPRLVAGVAAACLGRTRDNRLIERLVAVIKALLRARTAMRGTDVLVARNLEMLMLAVAAKRGRRIVYECLDIHRTLTGTGRAARLVQRVERALLKQVDLILTSSPRFVTEHFARIGNLAAPAIVFENKVLALGSDHPRPSARSPRDAHTPWTIGWFGMLRCRRSLALLTRIAAESEGRIEVLIAGRPSAAEFADFEAEIAAAPGVRFVGAYRPDELDTLYQQVDFAWAIDFFEEGENSTWLLPNRLYEASAHGVVPIALAGVETGAWLRRHKAGIVIDDPDRVAELAMLTDTEYAVLREAVLAIPQADLIADARDCAALALAVTGRRV